MKSPLVNRMSKEIDMLEKDPPPGIFCYPIQDSLTQLEAVIEGVADTPYEGGYFHLSIQIPEKYLFFFVKLCVIFVTVTHFLLQV